MGAAQRVSGTIHIGGAQAKPRVPSTPPKPVQWPDLPLAAANWDVHTRACMELATEAFPEAIIETVTLLLPSQTGNACVVVGPEGAAPLAPSRRAVTPVEPFGTDVFKELKQKLSAPSLLPEFKLEKK